MRLRTSLGQAGEGFKVEEVLRLPRLRLRFCLAAVGVLALAALVPGGAMAGSGVQTCSGTSDAPGVLSGTYGSNVVVNGDCQVNAGPAVVKGNLTIKAGSALIAAFGMNDQTGSGSSSLTVGGNLTVQSGGTLIMGCLPTSFPCFDDPSSDNPTLSSADIVSGNLTENGPLGVIVHDSTIDGNVTENGGGGGVTCDPIGIFSVFGSPAYSDYEDSTVGGNLGVSGLKSCWLGMARVSVGGGMRVLNDELDDPDAIEILSNTITGNLICHGNSMVWDSFDLSETGLFPRQPAPNTVNGHRIGQCVLSSPMTDGGPLGPGLF
jgi:hypothetical protein